MQLTNGVMHRLEICTISLAMHELRNELLDKLFLLLFFITTNKVKIHEEKSIANNRFDVT